MNNPGINNILKYLESEKKRFLNAAKSGMFCDSESCFDTAMIIKYAIEDIEESKEVFKLQ